MKCFDIGIFQSYLDGELYPMMMEGVMKHLDECEICRKQFDELLELNEWEASLKDEDVTDMIIDVQGAWKNVKSIVEPPNKIDKIKGVFSEMNRMKKGAMVAALLLVIATVPVAAVSVYNLFSEHVLEDKLVNEGMKNADGEVIDGTKNGVFQPLDKKITDKGITVHLTELYVSDSRMSIHYRIEDEKGNLVPLEYNTDGLDLKYDGIVDGKQVEAPEYYLDRKLGSFSTLQFLACEDNLPFELIKDGSQYNTGIRELGNKTDGTITFAAMEPIEYPMVLDININKIGKTEGSWKMQIDLNGNK
jgi:hypothetical protein